MDQIADYNDSELWIIRTAVRERYSKEVELMMADSELRLDGGSAQLTPCPTTVWEDNGATLAIFKTGEDCYRPQFYYKGHEQYGTGKKEFNDLGECVITLLQVQADHVTKNKTDSVDG